MLSFSQKKYAKKVPSNGGFTLVELMVSVALFAITIIIVSGAFLSIVDSYKKVTAQRENIDNLSTATESMVRGLKTGMNFHCGSTGTFTNPQSCLNGDTWLAFTKINDGHLIRYKFVACTGHSPEPVYCDRLQRKDSDDPFYPVTDEAGVIQITDFKFYVTGTDPLICVSCSGDVSQPKVIITMKGTVGTDPKKLSSFNLQTTITQRRPDIQF